MNPVPVGLAGTNIRQICMPDLAGPLRQSDTLGGDRIPGMVEEADLDLGRVLRVDSEIGPLAIPRGAEWGRGAGPHPRHARASL